MYMQCLLVWGGAKFPGHVNARTIIQKSNQTYMYRRVKLGALIHKSEEGRLISYLGPVELLIGTLINF